LYTSKVFNFDICDHIQKEYLNKINANLAPCNT
jgi:hypothetical protein